MSEDQLPRGGTPVWLRVTLAVSLALNLLIAGIVVGAVFGDRRSAERSVRDLAGTPFFMALEPGDRRDLMVSALREAGQPLRESRRALRQRFEALLLAIRADAFDRTAVEALLAEQRAAASHRTLLAERVLLDHLEGLGPEARRAYADRLEQSLRRGMRR